MLTLISDPLTLLTQTHLPSSPITLFFTMSTAQIYGTAEHPYSTLPETTEDRSSPSFSTLFTQSNRSPISVLSLVAWADLISLDLSKFDTTGGKESLAKQLKYAVHNVVRSSLSFFASHPLLTNLVMGVRVSST